MKSKTNPKVTIILPTYNRAHLVSRAVTSVLNQTYQDFELIIVDDCSIDNTEEIIENFCKQDQRVICIKHSRNKGGNAARNTGIKAARAEYIAFQDSDDEWLPGKLEKQVELLENMSRDEAGVVYTAFWRIEGKDKTYNPGNIKNKEGNIQAELLKGNFITTPSVLIKKECFEKAGLFDEDFPRLQDWEMWLRVAKYYHFKYINEPLLNSYYYADSISANSQALIKALELIVTKYFTEIGKERKLLAKYYIDIATLFLKDGNMGKGRRYLIKSLTVDPFRLKRIVILFLSVFGKVFYDKAINILRRIKNQNYGE